MTDRVEVIAHAIFDWLTHQDVEGGPYPPYTYNSDLEPLVTGVDGLLDCLALAKAIDAKLREEA